MPDNEQTNAPKRAGKQFTTEYQPLNRGRKKNVLSHVAELMGDEFKVELSTTDQFRIIQSLIERTEEELIEIDTNKSAPMFMRMIATVLLEDYKKKTLSTIETVYNRVHGKPKESVDTHLVGDMTFKLIIPKPKKSPDRLTPDKEENPDGEHSV